MISASSATVILKLMDSTVPVTVVGITSAVAVGAGYYFACALLSDGSIQCWGDNGLAYELGSGSTTLSCGSPPQPCSSVPVTVSGITNAVGLAVAKFHACALLNSGSIQCWGDDANGGELGNGSTIDSPVPVTVVGL